MVSEEKKNTKKQNKWEDITGHLHSDSMNTNIFSEPENNGTNVRAWDKGEGSNLMNHFKQTATNMYL